MTFPVIVLLFMHIGKWPGKFWFTDLYQEQNKTCRNPILRAGPAITLFFDKLKPNYFLIPCDLSIDWMERREILRIEVIFTRC